MPIKYVPVLNHCAICGRQLSPNATHILCEPCRMACGGYGRERAEEWFAHWPAIPGNDQ